MAIKVPSQINMLYSTLSKNRTLIKKIRIAPLYKEEGKRWYLSINMSGYNIEIPLPTTLRVVGSSMMTLPLNKKIKKYFKEKIVEGLSKNQAIVIDDDNCAYTTNNMLQANNFGKCLNNANIDYLTWALETMGITASLSADTRGLYGTIKYNTKKTPIVILFPTGNYTLTALFMHAIIGIGAALANNPPSKEDITNIFNGLDVIYKYTEENNVEIR